MKTFINNKLALMLTMFVAIALALSSCKKDPDPEPIVFGDAKISITNTVSGSNAQDFYQNDTKLTSTAVAYAQSSPYLTVKAGNSALSFRNTGSTNVTATTTVGLETNASYRVFYYSNSAGGARITGFGIDNTLPAAGKAKVKFINLGPALNNTLNVSVAGGAALLAGLAFEEPRSNYVTIDANTALEFSVLGSGLTSAIPAANFIAGKIYTVWFDAANATTAQFHIIQEN